MRIHSIGLCIGRNAFVAALLGLTSTHSAASSLELTVAHKTVGDTVRYTPNLAEGGFAVPTEKSRFNENLVEINWQHDDQFSVSGSIADRRFTSLRDDFGFLQSKLTLRYRLHSIGAGNTSVWLSASSNKARQLAKNSYTTIDDQVIKSATVLQPSDRKIEFGLDRRIILSPSTRALAFASLGATDTKHAGLKGSLTRGDCNYQFEFGYKGGSIEQIDQCGSVTALTRTYPDDQTVQQEFGVSPANDLRNQSTFGKVGFGLQKTYQAWSFSANYYFQRYFRDKIDSSISAAGYEVYDSNQVLSTTASYRVTNNIELSAQVEYHLHRYLDEVPVLYTRLTSERFKDDAVFFSVDLTYRLIR